MLQLVYYQREKIPEIKTKAQQPNFVQLKWPKMIKSYIHDLFTTLFVGEAITRRLSTTPQPINRAGR